MKLHRDSFRVDFIAAIAIAAIILGGMILAAAAGAWTEHGLGYYAIQAMGLK